MTDEIRDVLQVLRYCGTSALKAKPEEKSQDVTQAGFYQVCTCKTSNCMCPIHGNMTPSVTTYTEHPDTVRLQKIRERARALRDIHTGNFAQCWNKILDFIKDLAEGRE